MRGAKCRIKVESQRNLKSKAKSDRVGSCHRYFLVSLSVAFFMQSWLEDIERFNGLLHFWTSTFPICIDGQNVEALYEFLYFCNVVCVDSRAEVALLFPLCCYIVVVRRQ